MKNNIKIQKSIYKYLSKKAIDIESNHTNQFKNYLQAQKKLNKENFRLSTKYDLINEIIKSRVTYLGDFHTLDQNSKSLHRIIKTIISSENLITIGIEFVSINQQEYVNAYLNNYITELEFLESIDYVNEWRFPWEHYSIFFSLAKKYKLNIIALNSKGSLQQRDQKAAIKIVDYLLQYKNQNILILFGELHIFKDKLPRKVKQIYNQNMLSSKDYLIQTIVHQNLDNVYWKLLEDGLSSKEQVVRFNDNEFSIQISPPWIKYESMIYWYENITESPIDSLSSNIINKKSYLTLPENINETFIFFANEMNHLFKFGIIKEMIEDFNLYDSNKIELITEKIDSINKVEVRDYYKKMLIKSKSFILANDNLLYCSSYSLNKISFLCGQHLFKLILHKQKYDYDLDCLFSTNKFLKFKYFVYKSLFSYFISKNFNQYRKCNLYLDHINLSKKGNKDSIETIKILQSCSDNEVVEILHRKTMYNTYIMAKNIGFYMGDKLFDDVYKTNDFNNLFQIITNKEVFNKNFINILNRIINKDHMCKHKKRLF